MIHILTAIRFRAASAYGFETGSSRPVRGLLSATVGAQGYKPCFIAGQVVDQDRAPLSGAGVEITDGTAEHTHIVSTNADGKFAVDNLPSGVYSMTVSYPGYRTVKSENINLR